MNEFDQIWDAFKILAKVTADNIKARKEARRLRRNELARNRRKNQPKKVKAQPQPEPEYDPPDSCYCMVTSYPPCSWCEGQIMED